MLGTTIVASTIGSLMLSISAGFGRWSGLSTGISVPSRNVTRYSTVGAVPSSVRLNSRSRVSNIADIRDQVTDFTGGQVVDWRPLWTKDSDLVHLEGFAGLHHLGAESFAQGALEHPDVGDYPTIGIEFCVKDQGAQRRRRV